MLARKGFHLRWLTALIALSVILAALTPLEPAGAAIPVLDGPWPPERPGDDRLDGFVPAAPAPAFVYAGTHIPADTTAGNCATGTPYGVYVTAGGLTPASSYVVKVYHYTSANSNNRGCMWNWQTNAWVVIDNTYTGLPTITGVADWASWVFVKAVSADAGAVVNLRFRLREGSTNYTAANRTPTALNLATGGGWIAGHTYDTGGSLLSGGPVIRLHPVS